MKRLISGSLLVTGTCVGAGMLGLPVVTGPSGLLPTIGVNLLAYLLMLCTGFFFLEVTLSFPEGANLMTMSEAILGKVGKWISAGSFLFLYFCLLVVYVSGGAPLFPIESHLAFSLFFGGLVWLGPSFVGRVNSFLMVGLVASFSLLIWCAIGEVEVVRFEPYVLSSSFLALPTLLSAFGFHNVIPTLVSYLNRDRRALFWSLTIGVTFSLVIYLLWQIVIIGSIPREMIEEASIKGVPITQVLFSLSKNSWLIKMSSLFAFFALTTSLLGVSLSTVDFLADGFNVRNEGWRRLILILLVFVPPTILSKTYPHLFMKALGLAGGVGEALLNGLIPLALIIYRKPLSPRLTHPFLLGFVGLTTLLIMAIELGDLLHRTLF